MSTCFVVALFPSPVPIPIPSTSSFATLRNLRIFPEPSPAIRTCLAWKLARQLCAVSLPPTLFATQTSVTAKASTSSLVSADGLTLLAPICTARKMGVIWSKQVHSPDEGPHARSQPYYHISKHRQSGGYQNPLHASAQRKQLGTQPNSVVQL